ncbi:MAG: tRNA (N6-isopentenyl adenosine(37)-C2)-methylthiotransferase MiaB [Actinomycetia bacterium]|nr:tRNA (N6-isopentenyl adenosine(37)-C2)-methylthiotransferase MiaB [Actinomycetes bacterium]
MNQNKQLTLDVDKNTMKAYIKTFGCQMNEYDSERIAYYLQGQGYSLTGKLSDADIIVFNTCAVRQKAKNKLYGHLGNLKILKKENPDLIICVGGCTAQNLKQEITDDFPFVDIVFGTLNISELPQLIEENRRADSSICRVPDSGFDYHLGNSENTYSFKAYVPIITGCNNFCSYCIVPLVRGREKSLAPDGIIGQIKHLAANEVMEVTLLGQNVNSYGNDLKQDIDFSDLLQRVSDTGINRIRFMTSHPKDFSSKAIEVIGSRENIANHIHLPLQSGSNLVLDRMNRKYNAEKYMDIVSRIRKNIEDCSLTTDIIVGFPGEERKDFEKTLDMIKKIRFKRAFTFIYSPRQGTGAAEYDDPVSSDEKKKWFLQLLEAQNRISYEENLKMQGKRFVTLVEGPSPKGKGMLQGRLEDNTIALFEGKPELTGKLVLLDIAEAKNFYLIGKLKKLCKV